VTAAGALLFRTRKKAS